MFRPVGLFAILAIGASVLSTSAFAQQAQTPAATPSKFETLTTGMKKYDGGFWTIYTKDQQILVEIKQAQLGQDFLMLSSVARGVSQGLVLGGMTWGDDVLWSFRKVGDKSNSRPNQELPKRRQSDWLTVTQSFMRFRFLPTPVVAIWLT